jgi:hypothetical protein
MSFRIVNPPDEEIAWCIQLYQSYPRQCLHYLRQSYPRSRVVLLVDGDAENVERYQALGREFQTQVIFGEHLMEFQTNHLYVARLMHQAVAGPETYFFRIDPDTRIWRRFSWLPGMSCAFGTLETVTVAFKDRIRHPPNIQGGCIGLTRDVSQSILTQDILSYDSCVKEARKGWVRTLDCEHLATSGKMLDDFVISWAVDTAGFPLIQHAEIASYWRDAINNKKLQFVVTHPHKEMDMADDS